jgi:hypothetical protein
MLCYWSTSKLCYMSVSKLGSPIARPPHSFVFFVRLHPTVWPPLHSHPPLACHPRSRRQTSCTSGRRRSPRQPSPLTRGVIVTVGDNPLTGDVAASSLPHRAPHPRLCHRRRPSPLLWTAPDGIFDLDSDCASVRKKEGTRWVGSAPSTRKIYRNKLCYISSSKTMYY